MNFSIFWPIVTTFKGVKEVDSLVPVTMPSLPEVGPGAEARGGKFKAFLLIDRHCHTPVKFSRSPETTRRLVHSEQP
jgi:hypothetical protein